MARSHDRACTTCWETAKLFYEAYGSSICLITHWISLQKNQLPFVFLMSLQGVNSGSQLSTELSLSSWFGCEQGVLSLIEWHDFSASVSECFCTRPHVKYTQLRHCTIQLFPMYLGFKYISCDTPVLNLKFRDASLSQLLKIYFFYLACQDIAHLSPTYRPPYVIDIIMAVSCTYLQIFLLQVQQSEMCLSEITEKWRQYVILSELVLLCNFDT